MARFDNASITLVNTPLAGAVCVAPFALANWQMPESAWAWFVLLNTGLFRGFGHWLAPPISAPLGYISIIFKIALRLLVFADVPKLGDLGRRALGLCVRFGASFPSNWGGRIGFADTGCEGCKIAFTD